TDIFPNIDIPVISVIWQYAGLSAQDLSERIVYIAERQMTTTVNNIEHIESQSMNGIAVIKIFFQPQANVSSAMAQVTGSMQTALRQMPQGTNPPLIISYNASTVPILQLAVSGTGLSEQALYDFASNFIRPQLITVPGTAIPLTYGGKQRQIQVDLNRQALQAKGMGPSDVVTALGNQNLILPAGTSKIGPLEYDVEMNGSPRSVAELNDLPVRTVGGATTYVRDVAHVRDGYPPQTNIVRADGSRGALMSVLKSGDESTIDIVAGVRAMLPSALSGLPPQLRVRPIADQSVFVKASINGVLREAVIAACLTALMILIFLGSWRSTIIIAVSIPLSILCSLFLLSALGETINIMTLGGLALAVGILVDDATVEIENINRNLELGKEIEQAILDGAAQIAIPAFVSTLSICIVFVPMFFLAGVARYLFVPLAEAVSFAMLASYLLSRTIVPTMAKYLLKAHSHHPAHEPVRNPFTHFQLMFERGFERLRLFYTRLLQKCIRQQRTFVACFLFVCVASMVGLIPWLGQDFFPAVDAGQFKLHIRAQTGTRIEETAKLCDLIDRTIRRVIPPSEVDNILDNIGLPYSGINTSYSNSGAIGPADADIQVSLTEGHAPTEQYVEKLRRILPDQFPGVTLYFLPADMVSQILNFGLPAAIDVQVLGHAVEQNRQFADRLLHEIRYIPGTTDLRIHQPFNQPKLFVNINRTKTQEVGFSARDVASNVLVTLSGSFQTSPTFWLNPKSGVSYNIVAQAPQYQMDSFQDLRNIPVAVGGASVSQILGNVAELKRGQGLGTVSHYNIAPVIDLYGSVQGTDLGSVAGEVDRIIDRDRHFLPPGSKVVVRGQIDTMRNSFRGLMGGLLFSIVLVYMLIVINFQSWLDPFIIISALPAALAGIVWCLFITHTTASVPALTGSIMCMGVATANSILVVSFAKEQLPDVDSAADAALLAGSTRFRPVLMTALAMIMGMLPMALGLGEGGEQNAPLGRAVIGGLTFGTLATLFFVPVFFGLLHGRRRSAQ
ncbi:MAG: Cation efflux system protein CusA, partial [Bryobacterales bacterium]|nr:Cation efflux system protein CusA [Bryobacterales bacterium]